MADVAATRSLLRRERFDVLAVRTSHGWATLARDIPLMWATRKRAGAIALQFHGSRTDWLTQPGHGIFKACTRLLLRYPDMILLLSQEEARQFGQFLPG